VLSERASLALIFLLFLIKNLPPKKKKEKNNLSLEGMLKKPIENPPPTLKPKICFKIWWIPPRII